MSNPSYVLEDMLTVVDEQVENINSSLEQVQSQLDNHTIESIGPEKGICNVISDDTTGLLTVHLKTTTLQKVQETYPEAYLYIGDTYGTISWSPLGNVTDWEYRTPSGPSFMAVTHYNSPYVTIYDTSDWSKISDPWILPTFTGHGVTFSPDNSLMVVGYGQDRPCIVIYNTSDWSKVPGPYIYPFWTVHAIAFSPDGLLMAIAVGYDTDLHLLIYNTSDWSKVADPSVLPSDTARGVAFSPNGLLMAVTLGYNSPSLLIYNTSDWSTITGPSPLSGSVLWVTFNSSGSLMAVAHDSTPYVTIYNTSDWSKVADPSVLPTYTAHSIAFSPDDSLMVVGYGQYSPYVIIYNTSDWSKVDDPDELPTWTVHSVAFSSNGSLLAATYGDSNYIIIYNTSDWSKVDDPVELPTGTGHGVTFGRGTLPVPIPIPPVNYSTTSWGCSIFNSGITSHTSSVMIDSTHVMISYWDMSNNRYGTSIIGTISGSTITWGNEYVFETENFNNSPSSVMLDSTHVMILYNDGFNNSYGFSIIGTISSGNVITFGSRYVFNYNDATFISSVMLDSTHVIVNYNSSGDSGYGTSRIGTISNGDEITWGGKVFFNESFTNFIFSVMLDSNHVMIVYRDYNNDFIGNSIIGTISSEYVITWGNARVFNYGNNAFSDISSFIKLDSTHVMVNYYDSGINESLSVIGTISNENEIAWGKECKYSGDVGESSSVMLDSTHVMINYTDYENSGYGTSRIGIIYNGDRITFGAKFIFRNGYIESLSSVMVDSTHVMINFSDETTYYGTSCLYITTEVPQPYVTIEGWVIQSDSSYPDCSSIRIKIDDGYIELVDNLTGTTDTTASVSQHIEICPDGGGTYKTECDFTFTAEIGAIFTMQIYYEGVWYDYYNEYISISNEVPSVDTTITLGCGGGETPT